MWNSLDKHLAFGKAATDTYNKMYLFYKIADNYTKAFDYKILYEFNELFKTIMKIKKKDTLELLDFDKLILKDNKPAEVLLIAIKAKPRSAKSFLIAAQKLITRYWKRMLEEYLNTDKDKIKNIMKGKASKEDIKKLIYILTKNLNKNDRTFRKRAYNAVFSDVLLHKIYKREKTNTEKIVNELIEEGKLWEDEDGYIYINQEESDK